MTSPKPRADHHLRGIALRVLAAACFSVMGAMLKLASTRGVTAPEMIFYRNALGLPLIVGWVLLAPGVKALATRRPLAHVWRAALGLTSMVVVFQALVMLPLAEATTINFTAPVLATILSWLILRERVGRHRWAAVLVGLVGVVVMLRPGETQDPIPALGVVVGLFGALGQASVHITLRHLQASEHVAATVFWFTTAGSIVGLALLPFFGQTHDWSTIAVLAAAGTAGAAAQLFLTGSLSAAPVGVVAPFDYLQLFGAMLLGWLLLGTLPTVHTLAGAALIIAAGLYTVWREQRRRKLASAVVADP